MADAGGGGIGTVRQEWGVRRSATGNMLRRGKQPGPRSPTGASASFELRACARAREGDSFCKKKTGTGLGRNRGGVSAPNRSYPPARDRASARGRQDTVPRDGWRWRGRRGPIRERGPIGNGQPRAGR